MGIIFFIKTQNSKTKWSKSNSKTHKDLNTSRSTGSATRERKFSTTL